MKKTNPCFAALFALTLCGCAQVTQQSVESDALSVAQEYITDPRVAIFHVKPELLETGVQITGITTEPKALDTLLKRYEEQKLSVLNRVKVVPNMSADKESWALIRVPVASIYDKPEYTKAILTQVVFGTPVTVLQGSNWKQIQTPDGYIGWVPQAQVSVYTNEIFSKINEKLPAYMVVSDEARVLDTKDRKTTLTRLFAGSLVHKIERLGSYDRIFLPPNRSGLIPSAQTEEVHVCTNKWTELEANPKNFDAALTKLAKNMLGTTYLWAGTSRNGVDCSGLISHLFRMMGYVVPRDSDQLATIGETKEMPSSVGDLLFFGSKKDGITRISHVALYLGEGIYIHAMGDVHLSSLDEKSDCFDAYNKARYLFSVTPDRKKLIKIAEHPFMQSPARSLKEKGHQ